jgi:D-arabinose 1-dehydrogenase-like Zn-dependent alcohol dehydrogenase
MGMRVIAVDVGDSKLKYCKSLGAEFTVDATNPEAVAEVIPNIHSV